MYNTDAGALMPQRLALEKLNVSYKSNITKVKGNKMKTKITHTLRHTLMGLLFLQLISPCEATPGKPATGTTTNTAGQIVNRDVKKRKLPIVYSAKDGNKTLKYIFKPKRKQVGNKVTFDLLAYGREGTTPADMKAVKKGSPAWRKMVADKKKERARRFKAACMAASTTGAAKKACLAKLRTASADILVKFTSDETSTDASNQEAESTAPYAGAPANESSSGSERNAGEDTDALLGRLNSELDELGASADSEDPDAYENALEKVIGTMDEAEAALTSKGDSESANMIQSIENDLVGAESAEDATEEPEEDAIEIEDDEEQVEPSDQG